VDSVYFGSHNFEEVVAGCGSSCSFTVTSMTARLKATTQSRFSVDTRKLTNEPISGRGLKLNCVNLSRFPNIELARCTLSLITGHEMPVYLHWLGLTRVRATSFFTNYELAYINIVLNVTRKLLVNDSLTRDETDTEELAKLKLFESKVAGGPSSKVLKARKYQLSCGSMQEFAQKFMQVLAKLCTCTDIHFVKYFTSNMTGMAFKGELSDHLKYEKLRSFGRSLRHNCYFAASLAGCKRIFQRNPKLWKIIESQPDMRHLEQVTKKFTEEIYRIIREELFVILDTPRAAFDGDIQYHFDIASEYSPVKQDKISFVLSGIKAMESFRGFLDQPRPNVRFKKDPPPPVFVSEEAESDRDEEEEEEQSVVYEGEDEYPPWEFMNAVDTSVFETGEVFPPSHALLVLDEDSEEGNKPGANKCWFFRDLCFQFTNLEFSGFVKFNYKSRNFRHQDHIHCRSLTPFVSL
jgi:hypothetical protein